jgi:hypothetical protein
VRTLAAGISRFKESPVALLPITAEGVVGGVLIALGVLPHTGTAAAVGGAFPLDVFFDVKQALAQASSWPIFAVAIVASIGVRSGVLAATLAAAAGSFDGFASLWVRCVRLVATAAAVLLPSAILMFAGVASRYAPFIWVGALAGLIPALRLARRAVKLDGGDDDAKIPEGFSFLAYAYLTALFGTAMSSFGEIGRLASAAIVIFSAPLHALIFLGWREHARKGTYPGGGVLAIAATVIVVAVLLSGTVYDRYVRDFPPVSRADARGTLLLLGGVDSDSETGALSDIDVRRFGFPDERAKVLSYRGVDEPWTKADTHGDLTEIAVAVSDQIAEAEEPTVMLGHSQAALILDRIVDRGLDGPQRSAVFAPPPPFPPSVLIPAPDESGVGKPGGDLTRAFASALDAIGLESFEVDSPGFPTNLEAVALIDSDVRRLAVWALGDSVWLDRDWRRPGETNIVAITDHVGVVNNGRALEVTKGFFEGVGPESDEASWRGAMASLLRHAFAPWRPAVD